ncbi:MAG: hypothetical protein J6B09_02695 [Clostridia bacterium]|nr:hypothetical protein [Clostridia bacterium]
MPVLSFASYACAECIGVTDGRERHLEESIYLLNEEYTIVGVRKADGLNASAPTIGDRFFDHFMASPEERTMLRHMRSSISCDSLLIRAGGRPVLMMCRFFARTRLLVAIVPEGEARACLEAPARYADVLEALHVQLSAQARVPGEVLDGDGYALLCEWLSRVHIPLFFEGYQSNRADADIATVATRLSHLALLCGCRMEYDLSGFGYEPLRVEDFDLMIGTAFAMLLMAHRVCRDRLALIEGKHIYGEGPVLEVCLNCDALTETLSEIEVLSREAVTRDDLFAAYHCQSSSFPLKLEFSFRNKELSAQDVKVKILFDAGADTIRTYALTDEEITAAQDEINALKR